MRNDLQITKENESLFSPDKLEHSMKVADLICKTDMTPKGYKNKPNDTLIAMELGRTWGLGPLQAIQNIAVINGKPCAYGDLVLAICSSHPDFEDIAEEPIIKNGEIVGYTCTVSRKGRTPVVQVFTKDQAQKAGLWGRPGPWTQYPSRMLQMRARGFCLRDSFADALNGVAIREEVEDHENKIIDMEIEKPISKSQKLLEKLNAAKVKVNEDEVLNPNDEETGLIASNEQLEEIHALMSVKVFENGRLAKALSHYGVETLSQLTSLQAHDFIDKLNKCEDK